jgi:two-component system, NtrC family, response regulator GlrR
MERAVIMNLTTKPAKVLVVDDDSLNLRLTAKTLGGAGFVPRMAANGEEAVRWIGMEQFDAVVTDVRMPGISGIELLMRIRERLPWLPVIIMSGRVEEDIRAAASTWGVAAVLQKPVNRAELISAITTALADAAPPFAPIAPVEVEAEAVAAA